MIALFFTLSLSSIAALSASPAPLSQSPQQNENALSELLTETQELRSEFKNFIEGKFLPLMSSIMDPRETEHYQDVLAPSLYKEIKTNKVAQKKLNYIIEKINKNSKIPFKWNSHNKKKYVFKFIKKYKNSSDYEILSHQLKGTSEGLYRGAFNVFIDLVTQSFQPAEHKWQGSWTPDLFAASNEKHQKIFAFIELFSHVTALKGDLSRIKENLDPQAKLMKEPESVLILSISEMNKQLKIRLKDCVQALKKLQSQIQGKQHLEQIEEMIQNIEDQLAWIKI